VRVAARAAALALAGLAALAGSGCGKASMPSPAELALEREDLVFVARALQSVQGEATAEVVATRAAWPQIYAGLPRRQYAVVAVNADGEDAASVLAYHIYFGFPFPAVLDPSSHPGSFHQPGSPGPVSSSYRVGLFPTFYIVDPHGRIAWRAHGEQPDALLLRELRRAG
jgi:hypothetical protein